MQTLGTFVAGTQVAVEFGPFYDFTGNVATLSGTPQAKVYVAGSNTVQIDAANLTPVGNVYCISIDTTGLFGQYTVRITTGQVTGGASVVGQGAQFTVSALAVTVSGLTDLDYELNGVFPWSNAGNYFVFLGRGTIAQTSTGWQISNLDATSHTWTAPSLLGPWTAGGDYGTGSPTSTISGREISFALDINGNPLATSAQIAALPTGTPPTPAQIATQVWTDTTGSDFTTNGSPGMQLQTTLPAAVAAIPVPPTTTAIALAVQALAPFQDLVNACLQAGIPGFALDVTGDPAFAATFYPDGLATNSLPNFESLVDVSYDISNDGANWYMWPNDGTKWMGPSVAYPPMGTYTNTDPPDGVSGTAYVTASGVTLASNGAQISTAVNAATAIQSIAQATTGSPTPVLADVVPLGADGGIAQGPVVATADTSAIASAMWSNTQRTLTGTGGAIGPTAGANLGPIAFGPVVPGQTLDLSACVSINGQYITAEETSAIVYTIVDCDSGLPVPGHVGVALVPATPYVGTPGTCCLSDTILTDAEASNYNFRFRPSLASKSPFPECGRYAVAVTFTVGGQPYFANFRGEARY